MQLQCTALCRLIFSFANCIRLKHNDILNTILKDLYNKGTFRIRHLVCKMLNSHDNCKSRNHNVTSMFSLLLLVNFKVTGHDLVTKKDSNQVIIT